MNTELIIHIEWDGPFKLDQLSELNNTDIDFGIYQIYGSHPIYGADVLLYIAKADRQTFSQRISQEEWIYNCDSKSVKIYIGRLAGSKTPGANRWSLEIELAEKLLIYAHSPARNTQNLNSIPDTAARDVHILNWGNYRNLLPEVSGARYTSKYDNIKNYEIYGAHKKLKKSQ